MPRRTTARACIALLILALLMPAVVFAGETEGREPRAPGALRYDLRMDLAMTSIATAGWAITWGAVEQLAPSGCRWCSVNAFDDWGHRNIRWSDTAAASRASDVAAYAAAPLLAFGLDALAAHDQGALDDFPLDALIIAEAVALSQFTAQLVKIAVGRERPDAHFGGGSTSPRDNISFYSGHTSLAFSLAVASGTVASMRGYRLAPAVWAAGLSVAAAAGYFRIAADKHYLTDTIAGAVLGSAFGFGIPYLFHRPRTGGARRPILAALPVEGGGLVSVSGSW